MINVPISNPIRFRPLTGQTETNFDNEFDSDFNRENRSIKPFYQLYNSTFEFQAVTDEDVSLAASQYNVEFARSYTVDVIEKNGLYFHTFTMDDNFACGQIVISLVDQSTVTPVFLSEHLKYVTDEKDLHKFEWYNFDDSMLLEYFLSGLVCKTYLKCLLDWFQPGGDSSVFDNQGVDVKLESTLQRIMRLTADVPAYMAEIISAATDHDHFYIDDVEYTTAKKPTVTRIGNSNIYRLECELTQSALIGINTHDTGFEQLTNETIMNISNNSVTSSFEVALPAGYLLHVITAVLKAGSGTIEIGTTEGGGDILTETSIGISNPIITSVEHLHIDSATTIYVTIDGGCTLDVNVQLIKNIE